MCVEDPFLQVWSQIMVAIVFSQANTFQCVLANSEFQSFVIFLYAGGRIQWTTGDSSGGDDGLDGTEALSGINAGDGVNFVTISGSLTPRIINITQTSNINNPGVWMFRVGQCMSSVVFVVKCNHVI